MERLELSRLSTLDPKSSAATNYATSAFIEVAKVDIFLLTPNFYLGFFYLPMQFFLSCFIIAYDLANRVDHGVRLITKKNI